MRQLDLWPLASVGRGIVPPPDEERKPVSVTHPTRPLDGTHLCLWLAKQLKKPIRLVLTHNRSTMLSYREVDGTLCLRLHHIFLTATDAVLDDLVDYLKGSHTAPALDSFIRGLKPHIRPTMVCQPRGRFHDLSVIFAELNHTFFYDAVQVRLTWGKTRGRRYRRTIQLGCYLREERLIRIHPCLDQAFVPRHYVAWVLFHEMLHDVFGIESQGGRRRVHPPEFVALEQSYPDYQRCRAWEERYMPRLLSFRG